MYYGATGISMIHNSNFMILKHPEVKEMTKEEFMNKVRRYAYLFKIGECSERLQVFAEIEIEFDVKDQRIAELEEQLKKANSLIHEQKRRLASRMLPSKNKKPPMRRNKD